MDQPTDDEPSEAEEPRADAEGATAAAGTGGAVPEVRTDPEDDAPPPLSGLRSLGRLRFLIPIVTLLFIGAGVAVENSTRVPWAPLEIAPPPTATLPSMPAPAAGSRLGGRLLDQEARPVADALVFVNVAGRPAWSYTGEDGTFLFEDLEPGTRTVSIVARGLEPETLVFEGESAGELTLTPRPAHASIPEVQRATLTGRVLVSGSLGLRPVELQLVPLAPPETFGGALPRSANVGDDGAFEVPDLANGEYIVRVVPAWARGGSWPDLTQPLAKPDAGANTTSYEHLSDGHGPGDGVPPELAIELSVGRASGRLFDEEGEPIEGALVLVWPKGSPNRVWPPVATAPDGSFELDDLPAGEYVLTIRAGAGAAEQTLTIQTGETSTVDVGGFATGTPR